MSVPQQPESVTTRVLKGDTLVSGGFRHPIEIQVTSDESEQLSPVFWKKLQTKLTANFGRIKQKIKFHVNQFPFL